MLNPKNMFSNRNFIFINNIILYRNPSFSLPPVLPLPPPSHHSTPHSSLTHSEAAHGEIFKVCISFGAGPTPSSCILAEQEKFLNYIVSNIFEKMKCVFILNINI